MTGLRFVAVALVAVLLAGCVPVPSIERLTGSGRTVTKTYGLEEFSQVNVSSAFQVAISRADTFSVEVTVDDNLADKLDVRKAGDTLIIGVKPHVGFFGNTTLKAKVSLPVLTGVELSGATNGMLAGFDSARPLAVTVSGASKLTGDIRSGDAKMNVSGASTVELTGATQGLDVIVSGASTVALKQFTSADTKVSASGASHATVAPAGKLTAEASGASSVRYIGEPAGVKVNTSGASSVGPQ